MAASVTPTDAGLGAPTVLNPTVPVRVRRALNVESGLNDGLATPVVLIAIGLLATEEGGQIPRVLDIAIVPVTLALAVAVVIGAIAAWAIDLSERHGLSSATGRSVALLAVPFLAFGAADLVGANLFITAFVAGLVFGGMSATNRSQPRTSQSLELAADLLSYVVWFLAGGLIVIVLSGGFKWTWLLTAVAILTVLRILPVFVSLPGVGFRPPTWWFIGWFGPRGLATIVFALLALEDLGTQDGPMPDYLGVVAVTVLLSVFAHGISAGPLSAKYGKWVSQVKPAAETTIVVTPRTRGRAAHEPQ